MRATVTKASAAPEFPKLVRLRDLTDDHVVLMLAERHGVVVISAYSDQQPAGHFRSDWSMSLWEPFDGAVTLQN